MSANYARAACRIPRTGYSQAGHVNRGGLEKFGMSRIRAFLAWRWLGGSLAAVALFTGPSSRTWADPEPKSALPAATAKAAADSCCLAESVVLGASVSAGAEVALPGYPVKLMPTDATLADVLWAITDCKPEGDYASVFFFASAERNADSQIAKARDAKPKVVFAIDFLFWHLYGAKNGMADPLTDQERKELFERGLKRLETLDCPIVLADVPDMSHAISPFALQRPQVPSKAALDAANARLAEWAKGRKNIIIVSLKEVVAKAMAVEKVQLGGRIYEGSDARDLLAPSGLHATLTGLVAVGIECLDRMQAAGALPKDAAWERDPAKVKERLLKLKPAPAPKAR